MISSSISDFGAPTFSVHTERLKSHKCMAYTRASSLKKEEARPQAMHLSDLRRAVCAECMGAPEALMVEEIVLLEDSCINT